MYSENDPELEMLRLRKMMSMLASQPKRQTSEVGVDVVGELKRIVKGDRAAEIIDGAIRLYGDAAINVFSQILKLHKEGALGELTDADLYQILENLGLHVPIKTRIRIVRHGREERIGEE